MTPNDLLDYVLEDTIFEVSVWSTDEERVIWTGDLDEFKDTEYYDSEIESWEVCSKGNSIQFNI